MINQYIEGIFGQMRGNSMKNEKDVLILAIESSCDETAAAVVKNGIYMDQVKEQYYQM